MKLFFLKFFAFIGILGVLSFFFAYIYQKKFSTHLNTSEKTYWVLNQSTKKYNFAFIGSSRAFNTIDVNLIEKKLGLKGINMGTAGAGFPENYLIYQKFIQNNNKIDLLLIQTDILSLDSKDAYNYPFHDYLYVPFLKDSVTQSVFKNNTNPIKLFIWQHIPFAKYIEFNNYYTLHEALNIYKNPPTYNYDSTNGSEILYDLEFNEGKRSSFKQTVSIKPNDLKYLNKLIISAKNNGTKVVMFNSPTYYTFKEKQLNGAEILDSIYKIAASHTIKFIDFEKTPLCMEKKYFADNRHVNRSGAKKFSQLLADSISVHYQINN